MRVKQGPFRTTKTVTADAVVHVKPAVLGGYSVNNVSVAAVTVTFFDDTTTGGTNDIDAVTVPANSTVNLSPGAETTAGLVVKCSLWTSVTVYTRWAPR